MFPLDYRHGFVKESRHATTIVAIAVLLLAWGVSTIGQIRVSRLDWTGYDPDPDISQSLKNDARRANAFLPFGILAVALDAVAAGYAVFGMIRRRNVFLNGILLVLCLACLAWHGFTCLVVTVFST